MPYVITTIHTALYLQIPDFVYGDSHWTEDITQAASWSEIPVSLMQSIVAEFGMKEGTLLAAWIDSIHPNFIYYKRPKLPLI